MTTAPWTYEQRADTRVTNIRMAIWLFLASEAMFFGSLFSAYVLLRTGARTWPASSDVLDLPMALVNTALLIASTGALIGTRGGLRFAGLKPRATDARGVARDDLESAGLESRATPSALGRVARGFSPATVRARLLISAALAVAFLFVKAWEYNAKFDTGLGPATNLMLACWFTLTFLHALHVAGGAFVNGWVAWNAAVMPPQWLAERLHATRLYWYFVDLIWIAILVGFYFI